MADANTLDERFRPVEVNFQGGKNNPLYRQYAEELSYVANSGFKSGIEAMLANERYLARVFNTQVTPYDFSNEGRDIGQQDYKRKYDDSLADRIMLYSILSKLYGKNVQNANARKYAEPAGLLEYSLKNDGEGKEN